MPRRMPDRQRRAMFARLKAAGASPRTITFLRKHPAARDWNFKELRKRGMFLRFQGDADKDGTVNIKDCRPLDRKRQGIIHDFIKKKNAFVKRRNRKLEQKQDKLLRDIDNERTKLKKTRAVQKRILENKRLKQELADLKKANFAQTRTGKVIAVTTSPKVKRAARKFLKKIFN